MKSEAQCYTDKLQGTPTIKCQPGKMAILKAGHVCHMSFCPCLIYIFIISVEERGGVALRGGLVRGGHSCSCQRTGGNSSGGEEGRLNAKSVSLLWSVTSALLLKIAQERTTRGELQG